MKCIYFTFFVIFVYVYQLNGEDLSNGYQRDRVAQDAVHVYSLKDDQQIQEGRENYNMIVRDSKMPKYGGCWTKALKELESGCKNLNDDVQSRLALHFANCFLAKAGLDTYPCDSETDISQCLRTISTNAFTAYSNFFTHTQSMCHFLQTQVWQEETENTIGRLSHNTIKVVETLEDTSELQNAILEAQKKSLVQQERLLESSSLLGAALDLSKDNVKGMLEEFRLSTSEQRSLIFEVFDRLAKLQNLVLGEVSGFYSLIFYPLALLTVYLLTSTTRTSAARFWLFVLLSCSLALERCVTYWTVSESSGYLPADEASKEMYWKIWLIRKMAIALCALLLAYYAYKFQDYNIINNALLVQIQRQNQELKSFMETLGFRGVGNHMSADVIDFEPAERHDSGSDDSDFSYDSQASDRTYVPTIRHGKISSDDEDTFETAPSRPISVASGIIEIAPNPAPVEQPSKNDAAQNRVTRSRSRTPALQGAVQSESAPRASPYNLRSRSSLIPTYSPVVNKESPEAFGRMVKRMERITRNNASKILKSVKKINKPSFYSSDDE